MLFYLDLLKEPHFKKQLGCTALMRACSSQNNEVVRSRLDTSSNADNWNNKAVLKLLLDQVKADRTLTFRIGNNFFQISSNMLMALYLMAIVGLFLNVLPLHE